MDQDRERASWGKRLGIGAGVLAGIGVLGALGYAIFGGESKPQRQVVNTVTRISLPPPPPPPPPPKVDPPPQVQQPRIQEPQRPMERVQPQTPQPRPQQPPGPPPALGLPTGPGGANPYGIGQGSGDGTVIGGGGGGGGSRWGAYAGEIQQRLQQAIQADQEIARGNRSLQMRFWVGPGGEITRAQVIGSTGSQDRDRRLEQLATRQRLRPPEPDMPQPVNIRITLRA